MTQFLSPKLKRSLSEDGTDERLTYWCQGCEGIHQVRIKGATAWGWNGSVDAPTFRPSVLVSRDTWCPPVTSENLHEWKTSPWKQEQKHLTCHTFITNGMVEFLGDCTHSLAGQTLPLPDLPDYHKEAVHE